MLLRRAGFVVCLWVLLHAEAAFGYAPNPRLLQLVPPESRMVAGAMSSTGAGGLSGFLLVTRNNEVDHKDFLALAGSDPSLRIDEAVFIAGGGPDGQLIEHSLLVSGHFDRDAIFRMASDGGASRESYRGIPVLAVQPFAREVGSFRELRWLAIPEEGIAVWGSVASVQRELDRWIEKSPTDSDLLERLGRLDVRDETWCLLPAARQDGPVATILGSLDARLGALVGQGRSIQYGIHIGRNVEISAASSPAERAGWNVPRDRPGIAAEAASSFLGESSEGNDTRLVRLRIRRQTYEKWQTLASGDDFWMKRASFR